jgi:hypothetical protein
MIQLKIAQLGVESFSSKVAVVSFSLTVYEKESQRTFAEDSQTAVPES